MKTISLLHLRTRSTLRILGKAQPEVRDRIINVESRLKLLDQILTSIAEAPESVWESALEEVIEAALSDALDAIDETISRGTEDD